MKISSKIIHIPPYISTSWDNIRALFLKEGTLVIQLKEGTQVSIPGLDQSTLEVIFSAHAEFLDTQSRQKEQISPMRILQQNNISTPVSHPEQVASFQLAFSNMDSLNSALHHNPAQANMPALPEDILKKISAIAKIVAPDDIQNLPAPEPHCNCIHCQIARAIHQQFDGEKHPKQENEEPISDEDLKFQDWEITPNGDRLYTVVNKLNPQEKYQVYLGEPFGCTCGVQNCEHIVAVLKS